MKKTWNKLRHLLIVPLVVILAFFECFNMTVVEAATYIGALNDIKYDDFEDLVDDLEDDYKNKTVTIEMYTDWDYYKDHQFDERLYIPENCKATLNMHGHRFDRNNVKDDDYSKNGELIYVETDATLTINGASNEEEKNIKHEGVRVFTNTNQKNAESFITTYGATLAGGNSSAGPGAIYIDSGKEVKINDVTIAGCKASYYWNPFVSYTGYGGGILITEDNTELTLNNSTITGCLSQEDGGGIYVKNDDNIKIILNNSHIDNNYANSDGGGINMDGENVSITGTKGSSISGNKTNGYGGGVYFWNDDAVLRSDSKGNLTLNGNSAKYGGGVYIEEEGCTLENLIITNNTSSEEGGGVYIDNDNTTIHNCTITGNSKYGVYITADCNEGMYVTGSTIIKNNGSGNLILYDTTIYLNLNQNDEAEIHMDYLKEIPRVGQHITYEPSPDYSNQLFADDEDYTIVYNYHDSPMNGRRLLYIKKSEVEEGASKRVNADIVTIKTQDAHAYADTNDRVYAGMYTKAEGVTSGTEYQLRTIYPRHCSIGDRNFKMYYSDGLFFDDPIIYNDHLATASYGMAAAGAYLNAYDDDYKHGAARQFMADIGCPDQKIYVNDSNYNAPGTDTIGVTIASKTLQKYDGSDLVDTGYTLVAIATRGANYEKEWTSNVTLGIGDKNDGEAQGFSEAADQVMDALNQYIDIYDLEQELIEGKVKFWIAGFSRGGATANIVAKRVIENFCYKADEEGQPATNNQVFAYPLEAPKGGTDVAEKLSDKSKYFCIHNLINAGDLVPYVGPQEMGFKRYGVDHYVPGTYLGRKTKDAYLSCITTKTITPAGASAESGVTKVTTYSDNELLETKKNMKSEETESYKEYDIRRQNMIDHLATIAHDRLFYDYFYPYGSAANVHLMKKIGSYDGAKTEDFLANLIPFAQQETFDKTGYRKKYVENFQKLARAMFAQDDRSDDKMVLDAIKKGLDKVAHSDIDTLSMIFNVLGDYHNLDQEGKDYVRNYLWDIAEINGAFDDLTSAQKEIVKSNWLIIADAIFNFTDGDWQLGVYGEGTEGYHPFPETFEKWVNGDVGGKGVLENNLIYSLSLYKNSDMIIDNNHSLDIGMAWTRTYDNYYSAYTEGNNAGQIIDGTYKEYMVNWVNGSFNPDSYTVNKPDAYLSKNEKCKEASQYPDEYNIVDPNQKIMLEVGLIHEDVSPVNQTQGKGDVTGEAIYYETYKDGSGFKPLLDKGIYRGGLYLPSKTEGERFIVTTYAMSLGKKSDLATYYFEVYNGHEVSLLDGSSEEPKVYYYHSGEDVTITANPDNQHYFESWIVELLDENENVVDGDIAQYILNNKQSEATVRFTMPADGSTYAEGKTYPAKYKLNIKAVCLRMIKLVTALFPAPIAGSETQGLASQAVISFDDKLADEYNYPIVWTYTYGGKTYPATDTVYAKVDYTATIVMPKDQANRIVFAPTDDLTAMFIGVRDRVKENGINISRNDSDGSATLIIQFKTTEGETPLPPEAREIKVPIKPFDLNLGKYIAEETSIIVHPGDEITISAPTVADEIFFMWDFNKVSGIVPAEQSPDLGSKTIKIRVSSDISDAPGPIDAQFIPVINNISAQITAPVAGETMQTNADADTLKVTITNQYQIHPDFVDIIWSPQPKEGKADYLTNYTVTVKLSPKKDTQGKDYIKAKTAEDTKYIDIAAIFNYSENPVIKINDSTALLDKNSNSISYTFPMTTYTLVKIYPPEEVTGIPYGATEDEVKNALPAAVNITLDDGSTIKATVSWGTPKWSLGPDTYDSQVWLTSGEVNLPYGVDNKNNIPLTVVGKAITNAAESVTRAIPSKDPGVYQDDIRVALSCETEGATIFWTTDPDATDEDNYHNWNTYKGTPIPINRADASEDELDPKGQPTSRKKISLRVVSYKEGMRPDGPRTYSYIFANEIDVPETHDYVYDETVHIGIEGSELYTLEAISKGVTINENGDAEATEAGRYFVRAKIKEGYRWQIINPETEEKTYTTDDLTLMFIISTGPTPTPREKYTITYDLNYEWKKITETYDEGTIITIRKAPTRQGHTFLYWQGSIYYPGDLYTVIEDHTLTAVWKRNEPIPPYDPPRTGIE